MLGRSNATLRYTLLGALFGLMFPILSTLFDLYWQQLPLSAGSIIRVQSSSPLHWVIDTAPFFLGLFASFAGRREDRLSRAQEKAEQQVQQLQIMQCTLEEQVALQTADLARRNTQLQTAALVAREAATIQEEEQLLEAIVNLVSIGFGFYHAGIFLLDDQGEYAVLEVASSAGGQQMLARGHRLRVEEMGIVGHVAASGEPRIALDVGKDAVQLRNPDLPETRSEVALPLQARGETIGVLDVQSREPQAFTDEDVIVLQAMADQIAIAISNARLFEQVQESMEAQRKAYGAQRVRALQDLFRSQPGLAQRYDPEGILPANGHPREELRRAVQEGRSVLGRDQDSVALAVPLKVRERTVAVLDARKPAGSGAWTVEEIELFEVLVGQLGMALDSAQLYEDAQHRAAREQLLGEVAARMRETLDLETVLQTAIREIGEAMSIAEVEVRMGSSPTPNYSLTPEGLSSPGSTGREERGAAS
jgi:GAF domain-containing protein